MVGRRWVQWSAKSKAKILWQLKQFMQGMRKHIGLRARTWRTSMVDLFFDWSRLAVWTLKIFTKICAKAYAFILNLTRRSSSWFKLHDRCLASACLHTWRSQQLEHSGGAGMNFLASFIGRLRGGWASVILGIYEQPARWIRKKIAFLAGRDLYKISRFNALQSYHSHGEESSRKNFRWLLRWVDEVPVTWKEEIPNQNVWHNPIADILCIR